MQIISKDIITDEGEDKFQIRLIKEEGVGLLTTATNKNYLILDSLDFWYDLIQQKYPNIKKCKCKNDWFNIRFDYIPRSGTQGVRQINIVTKCTDCLTEKKQVSIDIKYSPTERLIADPLTYCEQPFIKYGFKEINCYWTNHDLKKFFSFMATDLQTDIYCWYWQRSDDKRHLEKVSLEKAFEIVTVNHRYFDFYFAAVTPDLKTNIYNNELYVEDDQWRRQELIQLSSPTVMAFGQGQTGLLFFINYGTQYVDKGIVLDKSDAFKGTTHKIEKWFKEYYIEVRGKDCFDNLEEHKRIFGDKFLKKKASSQQAVFISRGMNKPSS
jgi:hypothetical protein